MCFAQALLEYMTMATEAASVYTLLQAPNLSRFVTDEFKVHLGPGGEMSPLTSFAQVLIDSGNAGMRRVTRNFWDGNPLPESAANNIYGWLFHQLANTRIEGRVMNETQIEEWMLFTQRNHAAIAIGSALQAAEQGLITRRLSPQELVRIYNSGIHNTVLSELPYPTTAVAPFSVPIEQVWDLARKDLTLSFFLQDADRYLPNVIRHFFRVAQVDETQRQMIEAQLFAKARTAILSARRLANPNDPDRKAFAYDTMAKLGIPEGPANLDDVHVDEIAAELTAKMATARRSRNAATLKNLDTTYHIYDDIPPQAA